MGFCWGWGKIEEYDLGIRVCYLFKKYLVGLVSIIVYDFKDIEKNKIDGKFCFLWDLYFREGERKC